MQAARPAPVESTSVAGGAQTPAGRRELWLCVAAAVALVLFRSAVPLLCETLFDSDQAIVGLMGKHLAEFQSIPLFFYGQHYMLGVQAWMAAPFFWLGGATVTMLRLPLVIVNAGVAAAFVVLFSGLGMRPRLALVAALPFVATVPVISVELLSTPGASVEPFAYLLLLWCLRRRPAAFGAVLGVGTLHREFTLLALPAFLLAEWHERRSWSLGGAARAAAGFAAVWVVVGMAKQHPEVFGPPGDNRPAGSLVLGAQTVLSWLSFRWAPYAERLREAVSWGLRDMFGLRSHPLNGYSIPSALSEGSVVAALAFGTGLAVAIARLLRLMTRRQHRRADGARLFLYLGAVGVETVLVYGLNGGITIGSSPVMRYLLFALLLPTSVLGWYFLADDSPRWRSAVAVAIVVWAGSNVFDNARLQWEFVRRPPPNPHRVLADYLVGHGIRYAYADYWDSYVVTFLTQERVLVASTTKVRLESHQRLVEREAWHAVTIRREPCQGAIRFTGWCLDELRP
jgi:hypothetical protein